MFAKKLGWSFLLVVVLFTLTTATAWAQCSQKTIKGTWIVHEEGTILAPLPIPAPPPYLFLLVGTVTFDGAGNFSGTYVHSVAGVATPTATFTGTYQVSTDTVTGACTYSDDFYTSTGQHLHHTGFLSGQGALQEAHFIYTDPGWMISGTAKRALNAPSTE